MAAPAKQMLNFVTDSKIVLGKVQEASPLTAAHLYDGYYSPTPIHQWINIPIRCSPCLQSSKRKNKTRDTKRQFIIIKISKKKKIWFSKSSWCLPLIHQDRQIQATFGQKEPVGTREKDVEF